MDHPSIGKIPPTIHLRDICVFIFTLLRHHSSQECQIDPSINSPVTLSTMPQASLPLILPSFAKVVHIFGPRKPCSCIDTSSESAKKIEIKLKINLRGST